MEKVVIVESGIEVSLVHHGFDIVIVQFADGKQALMKPEEVGLKRRQRPKVSKYNW